MDFVHRYRELREAGQDRDIAIGVLRREGANFLRCIQALHDVEGLSLSACKDIVHRSPAWFEERESRDVFWDEVIRLLNQEAASE